jgi:hypothetical protein
MRDDTDDAYVPEHENPFMSHEWIDDIHALERSLNDLSCMFGERSERKTIPSTTEAPAAVLKAA